MSDSGRSGLLGRAGSRRRRLAGALRDRLPVLREPPNASALVELVAERAADAIDAMATRLLAEDEAAAQLAFVVEQCAVRSGREEVMAVVLRRNLWLDGTFLRIVEPLLRGEDQPRLDDATLASGRATLLRLLAEVAEPGGATPEADDDDAWWALFDERTADLPTDALEPFVRGEVPRDELAAFLVGSYTLFLQTFLLRSTARALPTLLEDARAARRAELPGAPSEESEPT